MPGTEDGSRPMRPVASDGIDESQIRPQGMSEERLKEIKEFSDRNGMVSSVGVDELVAEVRRCWGRMKELEEGVEDIRRNECDEPGCNKPVMCGTPTSNGYRSTCHEHAPKDN